MDIVILVSLVLDVPFIAGLGLDSCNMQFSDQRWKIFLLGYVGFLDH